MFDIQRLVELHDQCPPAMSFYRQLEQPRDWLRFERFTAGESTPSTAASSEPCIAFKFYPRAIVDIPRPMFETFAYSPLVDDVYLRGGLRGSACLEDFRTEVLGLVRCSRSRAR